jgi:ornithine carbamoyltransferase
MARSHIIMAALMGSDVRLAGPAHLAPPADVLAAGQAIAAKTGAQITVTEDVEAAVDGVDFIHTDVWVSMGESKEVWTDRITDLKPYQVSSGLMSASGKPGVKFMHCLPGFHDSNTVVGAEIMTHTNMPDGIEVTDEVFESDASIVFDQAENRLHTIKAVIVATLA